MISKEEYLENEEKIQKALAKSKEEREHRNKTEAQSKETDLAQMEQELLKKADDEKHVLSADNTQPIKTNVSQALTF